MKASNVNFILNFIETLNENTDFEKKNIYSLKKSILAKIFSLGNQNSTINFKLDS